MSIKVCKFGGTSMAHYKTILQVEKIINSDLSRKIVIVSAPGKRVESDPKITDTLYKCFEEKTETGSCRKSFNIIRDRFNEIVEDFKLTIKMNEILDKIEFNIDNSLTADYAASRGEYLTGLVMAEILNYEFLDPAEVIMFDSNGQFDSELTNDMITNRLSEKSCVVVPGFYGCDDNGEIKTFSRGGSDITGAIFAKALNADMYENWTDVNGIMVTDPRIVDNPHTIPTLSYKELREISYMGANVIHTDAVFPVASTGIPINIRNTFEPDNKGTLISTQQSEDRGRIVTGIAGKKGFSVIHIEESMMNSQVGYARRILSVLEHYKISFEHMPSGIDTLSIVVADKDIEGLEEKIIRKIYGTMCVEKVEIINELSLIATVGHGMSRKRGTASRLFKALSDADVNIRMIDQGSSELNIIVGVETADYETAIKAIYKEFIKD